jgi:hypothetical protein
MMGKPMADIVERMISWCFDWNSEPMADGEQPRIIPRVRDLREAAAEIMRLREALLKVRSYNEDIDAGRINYRPRDHIQVIDAALNSHKSEVSDGCNLISINEAAATGVDRIRLDVWANKHDHIQLDILDGRPGPWFKLWSPTNEPIGAKNPQTIFVTMMGDLDERCWRPYLRPVPDVAAINSHEREGG